jgi:hypothetical protein
VILCKKEKKRKRDESIFADLTSVKNRFIAV